MNSFGILFNTAWNPLLIIILINLLNRSFNNWITVVANLL